MTDEDNDLTLHMLRRLAVLEPDPARSDRVRARCRAAMTQKQDRQRQDGRATTAGRFTALILESGPTYGLSVAYLSAMIHDLLRVYMRR